jgi:hypothetical protein
MDLNALRKMKEDIEAVFQAEMDAKGSTPEPPKGQPFKLDTEESPAAEKPLIPEAAGAQDELFPGERAKYREAEKPPPAPPPEGGLFAKGEEGSPRKRISGRNQRSPSTRASR